MSVSSVGDLKFDVDPQIFQVSTAERDVGHHFDLAIPDLGDVDGVPEIANPVVHLDLIVQELLKGGNVEDLVADGLRTVDDVLDMLEWFVL